MPISSGESTTVVKVEVSLPWKRRTKVALLLLIFGIVAFVYGLVYNDIFAFVYGFILDVAAVGLWLKG